MDNVHTILLVEAKKNERTFGFYLSLLECQEAIIKMFEEDETATDFFKWLDSFYQLRLFQFDKTISRYRVTQGPELKKLFEEGESSCSPAQNGADSLNSPSIDVEEDDDWDD